MTLAAPSTLATLQAIQTVILNGSGVTFAPLGSTDAARYGVGRAIFIGVPKQYRANLLPQCSIEALTDAVTVSGQHGRVRDSLTVRVRTFVDFTDWWAAEQQVLTIRDLLLPLLAMHTAGGTLPGQPLTQLALTNGAVAGEFGTVNIGEVWYRNWSCNLTVTQVYAPLGGIVR